MSVRFFSWSLMITAAALLGHTYLYRRLVGATVRRRALRLAGLAVFVLLTLLLTSRRTIARHLPEALGHGLSKATMIWMGLGLCLVVALLCIDALRLALIAAWRAHKALTASKQATEADRAPSTDASQVDEDRRRFLAQAVAGTAVATGSLVAGYGVFRAFHAPEVTELAVRIPKLPRALDGLTIVQLTDIHVGPFIRRRFMDELVRQTNALKPDLVAITGDLVDGDVPTLGPAVAALGDLRARFGSYFVTGNHEYYSGDEAWTAFLEQIGVGVLRNRRVEIGDGGGVIDLVGVDDWSGGRRRGKRGYDLDAALAGRDPDRAAVLLAHQPANFRVAAERGIDLQISGHTHGGQLFPMTLLIGMHWEHVAGLYREADSHLYVSRGCGFWGPPMRVGSPPEIVKLVLTT